MVASRGGAYQRLRGRWYCYPCRDNLCGVSYFLAVSARVTLRQKFSNASELPTSRAKYVFPVPARAAVCAFEMHFADGRVITGVSKEKELAAQEHMAAIREGKASGLVDWVTDDCLFDHSRFKNRC
jgi:Vault protein inter-alpha-trypsin domain